MKTAFTPMPLPDRLDPAMTFIGKIQSRNELVFVSPPNPKPVARPASLKILPYRKKGRRFARCWGKETLCLGLFWKSEGSPKEAEIERRNGKVIYWLSSSA